MANRKLTDIPELTSITDDDLGYIVDVSDTTESAEGTSKRVKKSTLWNYIASKIVTIQQNKIITNTGFSLTGQNLTINTGWEWWLSNILNTNPAPIVKNIPFSSSGKSRIEYIVPNATNGFDQIAGAESTTIPIAPSIPNDGIYVTFYLVTDGTIGELTPPIVGDAFITKQEKQPFQVWNSGEIENVVLDEFFYGYLNFRGAVTNLKSIGTYTNAHLYSGKEILIKNSQATDITIFHLAAVSGFTFSFPNAANLVLEPNVIIRFSLKITDPTNGILEYVGDIAGGAETTATMGALIGSAGDATPNDTDYVATALTAGGLLKKITWTNVKAFLKTYFDTIYTTTGAVETQISTAISTKADLVGGFVPSTQLPAYVDDIIEGYLSGGIFYEEVGHTTVITGAIGKIYVDLTTGQSSKQYRWSGSVYIQITNGLIASTDNVPEGSTNLYFTAARVLATVISGFSAAAGTVVNTDTILQVINKLVGNIALKADIASPTFTGTPSAPTASVGTNTTQLATTAFVVANASGAGGITYNTYFINTVIGNNATGVFQDATHPFATIDYVFALPNFKSGDIIWLQNENGTFPMNGLFPNKNIKITSDVYVVLDFSSNSNGDITPYANPQTIEFNFPRGKILNNRTHGTGVRIENGSGTRTVILLVDEIYTDTSTYFCAPYILTMRVNKVSAYSLLIEGGVLSGSNKNSDEIIIGSFNCLGNGVGLISASVGVKIKILLIYGTGYYTFRGGYTTIGDIRTTGTCNIYGSAPTHLNFLNSNITSVGGINLMGDILGDAIVSGIIYSTTKVVGSPVDRTSNHLKLINFSCDMGAGQFEIHGCKLTIENSSIKSTNSPIKYLYNNGVNVVLKNSSFEVVNAVPLATGGSTGTHTLKIAGISGNFTALSDQSGTGVTVTQYTNY